LDRNNKEALAGESEIDFEGGDYRSAQVHLERALRRDPGNPKLTSMLEVAKLVQSINPDEPDLPNAERLRRIVLMFQRAMDRLRECAQPNGESTGPSQSPAPLQDIYLRAMKMEPQVKERILSRDAGKVTAVLSLVEEMENSSTAQCGGPAGLDKAIVLALKERGGNPK
jgi:hypothetical protein